MKSTNILLVSIIIILLSACSDRYTSTEGRLHGEWSYTREVFRTNSQFMDLDEGGIMTFREDETGFWSPSRGNSNVIEWDLQMDDATIIISRFFLPEFPPNTRVYDITLNKDGTITLTHDVTYTISLDSISMIRDFENIILAPR